MRNEKGQALVEFILIVPVLALFILGIFDVGNIIYKKYQLENQLDYVVDLYVGGKNIDIQSYLYKEKITMNTTMDNSYTTITLSKEISFVTPGASKLFGSAYSIEAERTIASES